MSLNLSVQKNSWPVSMQFCPGTVLSKNRPEKVMKFDGLEINIPAQDSNR